MDHPEELGFDLSAEDLALLFEELPTADEILKICEDIDWNSATEGNGDSGMLESYFEGAQNMQQESELTRESCEIDTPLSSRLMDTQVSLCSQNINEFERPCAVQPSPGPSTNSPSVVASSIKPIEEQKVHRKLHITQQPDKEFQFSTPSDIRQKKNRIIGSGGKNNDIIIELNCNDVADNYRHIVAFDIFIWCTLWQFPHNNNKKAMHRLMRNVSNGTLILLPMTFSDGKWQLEVKDLHICRTKPNDDYSVLCKKYEEFEKFQKQQIILNDNDKDRMKNLATEALNSPQNDVCIRFQAFTKENDNWYALTDPVFSNGFTEKINLTNIKPSETNIFGGTQISISTKQPLFDTENLSVFIKESVKDDEAWEHNERTNININKSNELSFIAPRYGGIHTTKQTIECKLYLMWPDGRQSKPIKFLYRNSQAPGGSKRQICANSSSAPESKRQYIFTDGIRKHRQLNACANLAPEEAFYKRVFLDSDHFKNENQINQRLNATPIHCQMEHEISVLNRISTALSCEADWAAKLKNINEDFMEDNNYNGNILHHLCQMNQTDFNRIGFEISTLLQHMQNLICQQNYAWETPLHVALQVGQQDCIQIFMELFICYADYSSITYELEQLFHVYDGNGWTVLHLAVLQNNIPLVGIMLEFAKVHKIDVCTIETLGSGDTILHLAESKHIWEMADLIMQQLPEAIEYENNAGERPLGNDRIIKELTDSLEHTKL